MSREILSQPDTLNSSVTWLHNIGKLLDRIKNQSLTILANVWPSGSDTDLASLGRLIGQADGPDVLVQVEAVQEFD